MVFFVVNCFDFDLFCHCKAPIAFLDENDGGVLCKGLLSWVLAGSIETEIVSILAGQLITVAATTCVFRFAAKENRNSQFHHSVSVPTAYEVRNTIFCIV